MIYLTRDSDEEGVLDDMIDVWSHEPVKVTVGKAIIWKSGEREYTLLKVLYYKEALRAFKVVPTSSREVVIVPRRSKPEPEGEFN